MSGVGKGVGEQSATIFVVFLAAAHASTTMLFKIKFKMYAIAHPSRVGVCFHFMLSSSVLCTGVACLSAVLVITRHNLHMFHAGGDQVLCME